MIISTHGTAQSNYSKIVKNGLVLWLDAMNKNSYPGSGTVWNDISGNGNTGTLTNGPTLTNENNGGILFDGVNDYVALPANAINPNADLTLSFWAKPNTYYVGGFGGSLISSYSEKGHLNLRYVDGFQLLSNYIEYYGTFANFSPTTAFIINNIVVTLTKSTNTWSLYVDGTYRSQIIASATFSATSIGLGTSSSGGGTLAEPLYGVIYSFHYYNRALSATEILQNYNATRSRFGV